MTWQILEGDVRERLRDLDDESVQTCVTSPPYWGLRNYGHVGQLGLEASPEEYVANLVAVFREVRRVLRDDGTVWLNLGDSYSGSGPNRQGDGVGASGVTNGAGLDTRSFRGCKPKDLVGIPWMVAFALRIDGWYLRSDIIWSKPNPMPESVTDRPTRGHEYLFLLTKSARYFYDADAIREPLTEATIQRDQSPRGRSQNGGGSVESMAGYDYSRDEQGDMQSNHAGANKRSVWTVTTQPYPNAHFATFPPKLVEPCILAGSAPGDTVLDPFAGSGTTGLVALRHERSFVGIELNPDYCELARNRIRDDAPLLNGHAELAA